MQKVLRGRGSLHRLPELMEETGMARPLVIGGRLTDKVKRIPGLQDAPVFSGYQPNPNLSDVPKGADLFSRNRCDGIISIGGGSAMDTAKAVKACLSASFEEVRNNRLPEESSVRHIAIPGTAGSGAEATANAVVYEENRKKSLSGEILLPEGVILDASLLESLPDYHRKSCALDALSQGIESYWSRAATDDSRVHAYLAILGVLDNLKAYLAGDPHAAEEMLDASYQSGRAIRLTRTTAAHAMSYRITRIFGLAHGHAVFLTLPVLWDWMWEHGDEMCRKRLAELSSVMRLGHPMMGSRLLRGILIHLGLEIPPMPDRETLEDLVQSVNPERLGNHPMKLSAEELRTIYIRAFLPMEKNTAQACLDIWRYYGGQENG